MCYKQKCKVVSLNLAHSVDLLGTFKVREPNVKWTKVKSQGNQVKILLRNHFRVLAFK